MSKILNKCIAAFDYVDQTLLVLSAASGVVSITSFASDIGASVRRASASISLVFSLCNRIVKQSLKTMTRKRNKHKRIVLLARNKLNTF